jgi:5-oxoprolinase (ATP-hydrolysing)
MSKSPLALARVKKSGKSPFEVLAASNEWSFSTELDNILLSVFAHRFMSIAEQMGRTLQRTSISTNIKERLDFSCALFGVRVARV